jgi:hypothetical protein
VTLNNSAEVFYESGGDALVHLVNYANRHVFHAVYDIQKAHPKSFPESWIGDVKEKFYRDPKEQALVSAKQQEHRFQNRPASSGTRHLYIDE